MEHPPKAWSSNANIILCADASFSIGAWMTLWSAHFHWRGKESPHFHLLTNEPDSHGIIRLKTLAAKRGIEVSIHPANMEAIRHLPIHRHAALTYLRLLVPDFLPNLSHYLYLDADLLIRDSLHPLFEINPPNAIGAVADFHLRELRTGLPYLGEEASVSDRRYFNAGVMLVNSVRWKAQKITEQTLDFLSRHSNSIINSDQDGLNGILKGDMFELPAEWNVQVGALEYYDRTGWPEERTALRHMRDHLLKNAKVVHFIGRAKPWNDGIRLAYAREYRSLLLKSGWIPAGCRTMWRFAWLCQALWASVKRRRSA